MISQTTTLETVSAEAAGACGAVALPGLGVLRARGEQACSFLQSQLTQDMESLSAGHSALAALCNAKGRTLASFIACRRSPDEFWLVCSRDLLAATLQRLGMFVLRAKVELEDASGDLHVFGLLGDAMFSIAAMADTEVHEEQNVTSFVAQLAPAGSTARALWIAPTGHRPPAGSTVSPAAWELAAVRSGVAMVTAPIAQAFVPQMLNYESVGGISFRKGCYPGQEVVARSQFRGAIKRRAYVGRVDGAAQAGQDVLAAGDAREPTGVIAQAARTPDGGTAVIAVLRAEDVATGIALRVGCTDGPRLDGLAIPYPLLSDL